MKILLFCIFLAVLSGPVSADPDLQVTQNRAAEARYQTLEKELDQVYQSIYSRLEGQQKERFRRSQELWKEYVEAEVYARVTPHIGGLQAIEVDYTTRSELSEVRIKILSQWMEQFSF